MLSELEIIKSTEKIPQSQWQVKTRVNAKNGYDSIMADVYPMEYIIVNEGDGFDILVYRWDVRLNKKREFQAMAQNIESPILQNIFYAVLNPAIK